jgi:hypothetical protein
MILGLYGGCSVARLLRLLLGLSSTFADLVTCSHEVGIVVLLYLSNTLRVVCPEITIAAFSGMPFRIMSHMPVRRIVDIALFLLSRPLSCPPQGSSRFAKRRVLAFGLWGCVGTGLVGSALCKPTSIIIAYHFQFPEGECGRGSRSSSRPA